MPLKLPDLIIYGPFACGKTRMAKMLFDVMPPGNAMLVAAASMSAGDPTLVKIPLLIIDDVASDHMAGIAALVVSRSESAVTILTTELHPSEWPVHCGNLSATHQLECFLRGARVIELVRK